MQADRECSQFRCTLSDADAVRRVKVRVLDHTVSRDIHAPRTQVLAGVRDGDAFFSFTLFSGPPIS